MILRSRWVLAFLLAGWCCTAVAFCDDKPAAKPDGEKEEGAADPKRTVKVEKGRLTSSVTLKGTVEGDTAAEISVRLKSWGGPLTVERAVGHGTPVKKGDVLLSFDSEKITQLVAEAREERDLARLAIKLAELELPLLKLQLPLDLQAAEREKKQAADDLQRFLAVDKPHQIDEAQFSLRSANFGVDSAREELTQLQKMYRDKDLTEETEQMILRRYKFMLESAESTLRSTKIHTEYTLTIDLPRREENSQLAAAKAALAWDRAREQFPLHVRQKELALEKSRFDDNRAREKLAELEGDLALMTIKSPADGVVYYGRYAHGQWTGPGAKEFLHGGTLPAHDVVLTIVSRGHLILHTDADEHEIADLKAGQAARIAPTRSPNKKLDGKVQRVAGVPQGGKFEVLIAFAADAVEGLVPGLTGSARVVTNRKENALSVPSTAVFEDADTESWYVYLPGKEPRKKTVTIGLVADEKTEIVTGLAEGDEILAAKP
jgi:HlyD family secretion protein